MMNVNVRQLEAIQEAEAAQRRLDNEDVPCRNCGYNLRGLKRDENCPECGRPIMQSLMGDLLVYSSPEYVANLLRGLWVVIAAYVLYLVGALGAIPVGISAAMATGGNLPPWVEIGATMFFLLASMAMIAGWWMFTSPDPALAQTETRKVARRWIRGAAIVQLVFTIIDFVAQTLALGGTTGPMTMPAIAAYSALGIISGVAGIVLFFASLHYVAFLARRVPDPQLAERAMQYRWILPLIYIVGACACGIGPLIAIIMYLVLLNNLRQGIAHVQAQQQKLHIEQPMP
jgi:hypothetical protein